MTVNGKIVRRVGLVVLLAVVVYYFVTLMQEWWAARQDDTRRSDAIVVLGAAQYNGTPSPVFKARLDHAADLYDEHVAPLIVVTGGKQTGDMFTEAPLLAAAAWCEDVLGRGPAPRLE